MQINPCAFSRVIRRMSILFHCIGNARLYGLVYDEPKNIPYLHCLNGIEDNVCSETSHTMCCCLIFFYNKEYLFNHIPLYAHLMLNDNDVSAQLVMNVYFICKVMKSHC